MALANRDPFARQELHRHSVDGKCDWCGNVNGRGKVYEYEWQHDAGRKAFLSAYGQVRRAARFCGESCRKAYFGE